MNESDVTICMDESRKGGSSFIVIYVHFHGRRTTAPPVSKGVGQNSRRRRARQERKQSRGSFTIVRGNPNPLMGNNFFCRFYLLSAKALKKYNVCTL